VHPFNIGFDFNRLMVDARVERYMARNLGVVMNVQLRWGSLGQDIDILNVLEGWRLFKGCSRILPQPVN
jgi:hypothetical protein